MSAARRDLLLSAVLVVAAEAELVLGSDGTREAAGTAALALSALAVRRSRPVSVLLAIVGALIVQAALGGALLEGVVPLVAVAVAAFSVGLKSAPRTAVTVGFGAAVGLVLANQLDSSTTASGVNDLVFYGLIAIGAPGAVGHGWGVRARAIAVLRERREQLEQDEEAALAARVAEEGSRLARSVHMAVAQRVGEIALQAAGAERVAVAEPARALESLGRIEITARAVLDDLREIIGVLRTHSGEVGR
jgi:signal transduction histidine kinase